MGIVNVTPDSFSGDGVIDVDAAADHAIEQWKAGADILDIGGESTRPGHVQIDAATEIARVVPVIERVRERLPNVPISIDTYKPKVVLAAYRAGADLVNSVWGAPDVLLDAALQCGMPIAIMHNQRDAQYDGDVVDAVVSFLAEAASRATARGFSPDRIILDPGIGFGKTPDHNIAVLRRLDRIVALGYPTLLGASRKSTLGKLTGRAPRERIAATGSTTAIGVMAGIDMVRVHDVAENRDAAAVADAVARQWRPQQWIE
jgi:dihydropteroate synthase